MKAGYDLNISIKHCMLHIYDLYFLSLPKYPRFHIAIDAGEDMTQQLHSGIKCNGEFEAKVKQLLV